MHYLIILGLFKILTVRTSSGEVVHFAEEQIPILALIKKLKGDSAFSYEDHTIISSWLRIKKLRVKQIISCSALIDIKCFR